MQLINLKSILCTRVTNTVDVYSYTGQCKFVLYILYSVQTVQYISFSMYLYTVLNALFVDAAATGNVYVSSPNGSGAAAWGSPLTENDKW